MKVMILDGFEEANATRQKVLDILLQELKKRGADIERVILSEEKIDYCRACFNCWLITPGICVIKDAVAQIAASFLKSDLVIFLTPVVLGGYSSCLKRILDRLVGLVLPSFVKIGKAGYHHKKRYSKYPKLLGLGIANQHDEEEAENFKKLVYRNSFNYHSELHEAKIITSNEPEDDIRLKISEAVQRLEGAK